MSLRHRGLVEEVRRRVARRDQLAAAIAHPRTGRYCATVPQLQAQLLDVERDLEEIGALVQRTPDRKAQA